MKYNLIAELNNLNINQFILGPHDCLSTNAAPAKICCSAQMIDLGSL